MKRITELPRASVIPETGILVFDDPVIGCHGIPYSAVKASPLLVEWTLSGAFALTNATYDSDGMMTTATVEWPDGSTGVFTTTVKNKTFLVADAYTITHVASGKTVTQPAVTRDAAGNVTTQPELIVS